MSGPHRTPPSEARTVRSASPVSRRTVLGVAGAALAAPLAGCTAEGSRQPAPSEPTPLVDTTLRVEPGRYDTVEFRLDDEQWTTVHANLSDRSVDVKQDGPAVDVVVMSADQYARFRESRTFDYVGGVSMPDVVNGQVSGPLGPGEYVLLVDNSDVGPAAPGQSGVTAVTELEVTATDERPR